METAQFLSEFELQNDDAPAILECHVEPQFGFMKQAWQKGGGVESHARQQAFDFAAHAVAERELRQAFVQVDHSRPWRFCDSIARRPDDLIEFGDESLLQVAGGPI